MILRVSNLRLDLHEVDDAPRRLAERAAAALGVAPAKVRALRVVRRSLDARGRRAPHFVVTVDAWVDAAPKGAGAKEAPPPRRPFEPGRRRAVTPPPIVVGAGPAGMFCALALVEAGIAPVVLERGRAVVPRKRDVALLYREGRLDPDSNVSFGEGGAGTFTDGKLSTRVRDPEVREVLHLLVELGGADSDILVTNKPHLGSERLPGIVMRLRERLVEAGCEFRFETRVTGLSVRNGRVAGVRLSGGGTMDADTVVLAPGNAGREIYEALAGLPGVMVQKSLAMGLRVEHPQALVDRIQYGPSAGHAALPPADYKLAATGAGRGVWAFCMCPGGVVVPTPTTEAGLCVNGMSGSRRASDFANSALVVEVGPADFATAGFGEDLLSGVRFQEAVEAAAFALGGGAFRAPAQRLTDYVRGHTGTLPARTSYPRGLVAADLSPLYPAVMGSALREAIERFGRTLRGFLTEEAVLIGAETRTSAPVAFPRDAGGESVALPGLYPCGEGCGHAGGIVSAAIDGLRIGRRVATRMLGTA
jgi:uncharacterized protein